ncbi:MAG TPA: ATP phosphoribosyltransferase regulatory subunit [Herpetosiphonaceae bacterium]|nr:ATP phosphoribosyltransferase regulatory subunit [Herpetosiphonaceae bacterium]
MQEYLQLEPVRGMRDHLPAEQEQLSATRAALEGVLDAWGYQEIDLPVLERRDLYLKKVGEDLVGKLYDFTHQGRALALRPEWTASVLRAYLRSLQSEPLPVRLRYGGPVFRYERPQRATYRQFTQIGVELIGGAAPRGDAEIIAVACEGLAAAGVHEWKLILGHVGVARTLLAQLGLPERTASQLLWSIERLRRGDSTALRAQLQASGSEETPDESLHLGALAGLPDEELAELLATTVRAMGLSLESTSRPAEAIIERLIRKLRRANPQPRIEQAIASLERLSQAYGEPETAFDTTTTLLRELDLPTTALDELRALVDLVVAQGIESPRLVIDLGLSRGLHYYSGMIFEIEGPDGLQLCGGGRYDDLVGALHPPGTRRLDVPAVGLAYGLERVVAQLAPAPASRPASILVAAPDAAFQAAMRVADSLRARGHRVLLDVRGRSLQANLRDAERRGCVALVSVEGAAMEEEVVWHDLSSHGNSAAPRRTSLPNFVHETAL